MNAGDTQALLAKLLGPAASIVSGYALRHAGGAQLVAQEGVVDALAVALVQHGSLYAWAGRQNQPHALRGRAPVYVATVSDGADLRVVVRHSWHGGLLAPLTGDRYLRPTRAPVELLNSWLLRERGIATPEFVGFALYNAGLGMARVDVVTRFIGNGFDFGAVLAGRAPGISREAAYDAIAHLLQQLAFHRAIHPDLNIKNILLLKAQDALVAVVLDVDVVQWPLHAPPRVVMQQNTRRLVRSMRKAERYLSVAFAEGECSAFLSRMNKLAVASGNAGSSLTL